jgi:hypothetical protein
VRAEGNATGADLALLPVCLLGKLAKLGHISTMERIYPIVYPATQPMAAVHSRQVLNRIMCQLLKKWHKNKA